MDNLRTPTDESGLFPVLGLAEHQIVQAQVGVHNESEAPMARGVDIDGDGEEEHSNVHMGELYWGTDPGDQLESPTTETTLEVEVDYMGNRDPRQMTTDEGVPVLEATERNFGLYGFDVAFEVDQQIDPGELEGICKSHPLGWARYMGPFDSGLHTISPGCIERISANSLNRWELGIIQDEYHDDPESLHLLWGTRLEHQWPGTPVDNVMGDAVDGATGIAMNNGAPGTGWGGYIENGFGVMVAVDEIGAHNVDSLQSTTMHELGHALGVGWADDTPIELAQVGLVPKGMEVYSGDVNGDGFQPDLSPEYIEVDGRAEPEWSIMGRITRDTRDDEVVTAQYPVFAFSIEELSTIDFEDVPSRDD